VAYSLIMRFGQASFYSGFFRSVCSAIGGLAELVGVACWLSLSYWSPERAVLLARQR